MRPLRRMKKSPPSQAWLVSFTDLVSLLITFFVMMFAMKSIDIERWKEIRGTLAGALPFTHVTQATPTNDEGLERIDLLRANPLDYLQTLLQQRFNQIDVLKSATLVREREGGMLIIRLPSSLLFASGSVTLLEKGDEAVGHLGDLLRNIGNRIEVVGHTDPNPIRGGPMATNWELSMHRAVGVLEKLRQSGVTSPMAAKGYGESRFGTLDPAQPLAIRYMQARRVDIIIRDEAAQEEH